MIVFIIFFVAMFAATGVCQVAMDESVSAKIQQLKNQQGLERRSATSRSAMPKAIADLYTTKIDTTALGVPVQYLLDKSIDEDNYYVGSGDNFIITIWGAVEKSYSLPVSVEGDVLVPFYGLVKVHGKTLAQAKKILSEIMLEIYQKPDKVIVALETISQFTAYILGEISSPGGYPANGVTRISDIIKMAGGITLAGKTRGIEITNELYEARVVDMAAFYQNGDITGNPYLRQGDRVFISSRKEFVTIDGSVQYPDTIDLCVGDNVGTIIAAAGGFSRGADTTKILIHRFADDVDSLVLYAINSSEAAHFQVRNDDRIFVCAIPEYRNHFNVTIGGEVRYPGTYPVRKDKTRLTDIIALAGGLTDDAFLRGSKIIRRFYTDVGGREFERVKSMPASNLSPLERSYLKTRLVEEDGVVSLDFEDLMRHGMELHNIILRNEDEIHIERKSLTVKVSGAVVLPGLVGYKEGAGYKYYIEQAGGFHTRARKLSVMIIKGGTEVMREPRKVDTIEAGDAIWVPEKEYVNTFQLTKDVLLILGSAATLALSIFTIQTILNK